MNKMNPTKMYRSYSILNEFDKHNIKNGRCPDYALGWHHQNEEHWPQGHDYFIGNGQEIDYNSRELREILSKRLRNGTLTDPILFCDLDGVLADFEQGVLNKFKKDVLNINTKLLWSVINKSETFFETLPWMPRGRELWSQISEFHPIILTGVPPGSATAAQQKINWCKKELGEDVDVITCLTKEKPKYCLYKSILIDDRSDNQSNWTKEGGLFLLYEEDRLEITVGNVHRHITSL